MPLIYKEMRETKSLTMLKFAKWELYAVYGTVVMYCVTVFGTATIETSPKKHTLE